MNGILQFLGSTLIGIQNTFRIRLQINLHFALGSHITRRRIVVERLSVNLIVAARIAAVERDGYIMQLGVPALAVLDRLAGLHLEQGMSLVGLRNREPLRALLNIEPDLPRYFL